MTLIFLIIVSSFLTFTQALVLSVKFIFTKAFFVKVFLLFLNYFFQVLSAKHPKQMMCTCFIKCFSSLVVFAAFHYVFFILAFKSSS